MSPKPTPGTTEPDAPTEASAEEQPGGRRRPVRRRGKQTRAKLLEAAETTFCRMGYLDCRVSDIVTEAHVGYGTFYSYFDSKEDIFGELAGDIFDKLSFALDGNQSSTDPAEQIRESNKHYLELYAEHARLIALVEQVSTFSEDLRLLRLLLRQGHIDRIERSIRRLHTDGIASLGDSDAATLANALEGMVNNLLFSWLVLDQAFDREKLLATINQVWIRALGLPETRTDPAT
jgi:AcrR family transcriptional regulator